MLPTEAPFQQYFGLDGKPIDGGYIYFGQPNQNPETAPIAVYWDAAGTQPAAQPIRTVNGYAVRNGNLAMIFASGQYSITVRNSKRELVYSEAASSVFDLNTSLSASGGAGLVGYTNGGFAITTEQALDILYYGSTDVRNPRFAGGAKGDGVTDDTAAVQAFFNFVTANGATGILPKGQYLLSSRVTINIGNVGFSITGPGCNAAEFIAAPGFSGAGAVVAIKGAGNSVGWRIGGFTVRPSGSGGAATIGVQIGDETVVAINVLGYQFSTLFDVFVSGFATLWKVVHARMIRFVDCAGWNQGFATANTVLAITQNGAFTGDLVFDKFQAVTTNAAGNRCLSITSSGPYNNSNGYNSIAGIKFRTCDFYAGEKAISIFAQGQSYIADIWFIGGCQIDQETVNAFYCESKDSGTLIENIHLDSVYANKSTAGTFVFSSTGTLGLIKSVWVESSEILAAVSNAITFFGPGCQDLHVIDNSIVDCANDGAAIEFNACTGVKASGNKARTGLLSQTPFYLLGFDAGTTDIYASGNDAAGVARISGINDQSGDTLKVIVNNPGFNPIDQGPVTVGASPFSYKNTSGSPMSMYITGGTVSQIAVDGLMIGAVAGGQFVPVPQGSTLQITYSVAPTLYKKGL